jgi:hypothetical protein
MVTCRLFLSSGENNILPIFRAPNQRQKKKSSWVPFPHRFEGAWAKLWNGSEIYRFQKQLWLWDVITNADKINPEII